MTVTAPTPTPAAAPDAAAPVPGSALSALTYDPFLRRAEKAGMAARRRELLLLAQGRVLELGAGTGLNAEHYPQGLERLVLAEPEPHMARRLRRRAQRQRPDAEVVSATAEALPFPDGAFDTVVSTMVLCTVQDPAAALAEIRRVLAPGGALLFIEHVRSEDERIARRQDRWHRLWAAWADGCRCNQPTLDLMRSHGMRVELIERAEWRRMPSLVRPLAVGCATA